MPGVGPGKFNPCESGDERSGRPGILELPIQCQLFLPDPSSGQCDVSFLDRTFPKLHGEKGRCLLGQGKYENPRGGSIQAVHRIEMPAKLPGDDLEADFQIRHPVGGILRRMHVHAGRLLHGHQVIVDMEDPELFHASQMTILPGCPNIKGMKKTILSLGLAGMLFLPVTSARADLDVHLVGVGTYSTPEFSPSRGTVSPKVSVGYGLLFDWPMVKGFKLEFGILSLPRKYEVTSAVTLATTSTEMSAWHVPLVFKFLVTPQFFLGLGGYYEVGAAGGAQTFASEGFESKGYGALVNAVYDFEIMPGIGWITDIRYLLGLRDMDPSGSGTAKFSEVVGVAGFRLGFGR